MDCDEFKSLIPESVFNELNDLFEKYELTTELRLAHFMAQCAHESGNFARTTENLNYSAERLVKVFPKYFNYELAEEYEHRPAKIGSYVYANRMGNGGEESGDGFKFRGRGYLQLTGRDNYERFNKAVPENVVRNPDLVATKYPLLSAAWFWNKKELNKLADENDIKAITKTINGGLNGLYDREKYFDRFYTVICK